MSRQPVAYAPSCFAQLGLRLTASGVKARSSTARKLPEHRQQPGGATWRRAPVDA